MKARTSIALITLACIFSCINAYASDSSLEKITALVSGNSLKITNRFGVSIVYFESDGTFSHLAPQGQMSSGKWRATKDSACVIVLPQPNDPPKEFCINLKNRRFGEVWREQDPKNGDLKRVLLAGHPKL